MAEEHAVMATLEEYAEAYCSKDIERLMGVFADGDDISLIGTGADEFCEGRSEVQSVFVRNFSDATASSFEWHRRHVTVSGTFAVVAIMLTIHLKTEAGPLRVPVRWTVALSQSAGRWRWLHRHASTASAAQEEGTAYPKG